MTASARIAFGACNDQDLQNNLWPIIEKRNPAAFIWGGDSIYADIELPKDWTLIPLKSEPLCADPNRLRQLYNQQKWVSGYRMLLQSNTTIFGTLDDHDYGCDNSDRNYRFRKESGIEFVNFIGQPLDSPMSLRARKGLGVYGVKLFDFGRFPGHVEVSDEEANIDPDLDNETGGNFSLAPSYSNKSVAVFVLDVRSNKSPWKKGIDGFWSDDEGDFLGEDQWQWFEAAIRRSRASVNVVVSGLQFHANLHPNCNIAEAWGRFPRAQQRFYNALLQDGVQAPILVSGDVHMSQFMRKDCKSSKSGSNHRSLLEMTTSGMTHSWGTLKSPLLSNPDRKPSFLERFERFAASNTMRLLHSVSHWNYLLMSHAPHNGLYSNGGGEGAKIGLQYSLEKNFGEMEFDWERRTVTLRTIGEDAISAPLLMANWTLDQLSGVEEIPGSLLTPEDFAKTGKGRRRSNGDWICVNHRGRPNAILELLGHATTIVATTILILVPLQLLVSLCLGVSRRRAHRHRKSLNRPIQKPLRTIRSASQQRIQQFPPRRLTNNI